MGNSQVSDSENEIESRAMMTASNEVVMDSMDLEKDLTSQLAVNIEENKSAQVEQIFTTSINNGRQIDSQKTGDILNECKEIIQVSDLIQVDKSKVPGEMTPQDKLDVKNIKSPTSALPESIQSVDILDVDKVLQKGNEQTFLSHSTLGTTARKITQIDVEGDSADNAVIDINRELMKLIPTKEKIPLEVAKSETVKNDIPKVIETQLLTVSENRGSSRHGKESDLFETNLQLGTANAKSIKPEIEISVPKSLPITHNEPNEFVTRLSSLKSVIPEQIRFAVQYGVKTITIKLEPETLGMMEIKVHEHAGNVGIQLTATNNEVHNILSQSLPQLKEVLRQEGIFVKDIQVFSNGTTNLMFNQNFHSQSFPKDNHAGVDTYHFNFDNHPVVEEAKTQHSYHNGTLSLWV